MALDVLPDEIVVRNRDEFVATMTGAYRLKRPNDDIGTGSVQLALMFALSDVLVGQSLNARVIGRQIPLSQVSGIKLDERLAELRLPPRRGETGATGFVVVTVSGGGADILEGDAITDEEKSGAAFESAVTDTFQDGQAVAIRGTSTGPATNLAAGTVLKWSSPADGLGPNATVQEPGLSGGRYAESDEEVRLRISDALADPAASGNAAAYLRLIENSGAHGVPVARGFVWPCCCGPGTIGFSFLLSASGPGVSRCPTQAQIGIVRQYILSVPEDETRIPPGDDMLLDVTLVPQPVTIALDVRWSRSGAGWRDAVPWPPRLPASEGAVVVSAVTDATHFTLARDDGDYTDAVQPAAGQTFCFYNKSTGKFARKRILSFTGTGPWPVTVDTSNDSSDATFVPIVGQRACPWSKSLDDVAKPIVDYFTTLGPGEQVDSTLMFDPGTRQKRVPPTPETWPDRVTNHLVTDVLDVVAVNNAIVEEGLGTIATIGSPGIVATQLELGDIAIFPLS